MTEHAAAEAAPDWSAWIGKTERKTEIVDVGRVAALAATLDLDETPGLGTPLPPGWHWLFFNPAVRRRELGPDGHPKRGGFLPPIALPRRMWAGSKMVYHAPLLVGTQAVRTSRIARIEQKTGRSGALVFVTVAHSIESGGSVCITEDQDIVYRPAMPSNGTAPAGESAHPDAHWKRVFLPDSVTLFRYSALTFNGHRIHYDQPYARNEENYPDLVVHGPLTATLLAQFALSCHPGRRLKTFQFRGVNPLFVGLPMALEAAPAENDDTLSLWAKNADGKLAMLCAATLAAASADI